MLHGGENLLPGYSLEIAKVIDEGMAQGVWN